MRVCFTRVEQVDEREAALRDLVRQAVEVETAGIALPDAPELVFVQELRDRLDREPALESSFMGLTPGRRRAYNMYVAGAKKTETRAARVEKCVPRILAGKGLRDL